MTIYADSSRLSHISLPKEIEPGKLGIRLPGSYKEHVFLEAVSFLKRYFKGEYVSWSGKLIPEGTIFQRRVWAETAKIPFGETVSYGELAARAGSPRAARAVGSAMANNPLPILVPCHRIICSNGGLGGYGGGLDMKRWLLRHEGIFISD